MMTWYLSKGEVLVSISDRFNVAISTVHDRVWMVIDYLNQLRVRLILWPRQVEAAAIAREFLDVGGYPDVIGAIDGCHITIKPPADQHDSYLDRKFTHSIVLQGICTGKKFFTNVNVGWPGAVHDARVLQESHIGNEILKHGPKDYFYSRYHLIGDSAYPCKNWLMTPYRDTGRLTDAQRFHNKTLSKTRVVIENAFGLLKGRWRILKYVNVNTPKKMVDIVVACCVLHNVYVLKNDFFNEEVDLDNYPDDTNGAESNIAGTDKRDVIKDFLFQSQQPVAQPSKRRRLF